MMVIVLQTSRHTRRDRPLLNRPRYRLLAPPRASSCPSTLQRAPLLLATRRSEAAITRLSSPYPHPRATDHIQTAPHTHPHRYARSRLCPPCARLTGECPLHGPLVPCSCPTHAASRVPSRRFPNHPCRRYTRHRTRGVEAVSVQHPGSLTHTARRRGFAHSRPASTTRDATECRRCYAA